MENIEIKEYHIEKNGWNPKSGKYSIPECYVTAIGFIEAAQILQDFLKTGSHSDKVKLVEQKLND